MSSELFQFLWPVPAGGFLWFDGEPTTDEKGLPVLPGTGTRGRVLVANTARSIHCRRYDPWRDHAALFRTFAALPCTEDGIGTFAHEYGHLGMDQMVSVRHSDSADGLGGTIGETFDNWVANIGKMKEAVALWDLIRAGKLSALREVIQWRKDRAGNPMVVYVPPTNESAGGAPVAVIASTNSFQEWLTQFSEGNPVTPAMAYLLRWINARIENDITVRLRYDLDEGQAVLRMVPRTLLGCLWLELAQAISSGKSQRLCPGCTQWFEIQSRGSRSDRQFCSPACRNREYRQRMAQAQAMRKAGKKPKEIATLLDVDVASVKKWISVRR